MAFDAHANFAYSGVAVAPSPANSGTTLTVSAGEGALFPAAPFNAVVWPAAETPLSTNAEIIRVTSKGSGDNWTIVRAQEGTSARAILVGDQIQNAPTVKVFTDLETSIVTTAGLISAINVSAGALAQDLSAVTFSNLNGVSFGLAASVLTASVQTNYQSTGAYLTTAALSQDSSKYAGTNGAITGGSLTVNTSGVSVNLPAYLTTAALSQDSSKYAGTNGAITGGSITVNTSGVSVNLPAYLTTAARSQDSSKYAGTAGAITGGSITVNTSGVSVNLPAYLTTAMQSNAVTLSNIKVSAGLTSALLSALTFADSNGLAFGLSGSTITGSYTSPPGTAGSDTAGISNLGNTSGTSGVISGDQIRLLFAGGNNITLSQSIDGSSATITISGPNVGGAQTGISGIVASDATYTSGTVTFTGVGGGVTVNSNTGQRIDISVAAPVAQSVQTQNFVALSLSGNTSGALALLSSGTAILAGGNNITLSQNGQSITISGANVGGAQTGISGVVVSDTTYTSGTISFSNAGNITVSSSVDGVTQYVRLSGHPAQTVQSAIKALGVSDTGQTAGDTGLSTGVDWVLAGSDSLTLSQSTTAGGPNTIWFKHPAWLTTAALSADSSKYAGTNGAITGGSITVNTSGISVNLPAYLSTQSTQFLALTIAGNTAGTSTFHATNNASLFFNGGNNITLSGNGSTVTIIGPNTSAQQTGISGIVVSDTTYTSGTVSFSNAGNITISSSVNAGTQYIKLSGNAAQTVQSAIKGFGASNTGNTAGNTGISTGIDWVVAGSNNITISESTAVGGPNTVWVSGPNVGAAQTGISGIVVSDTTYTSGTVSFSNAGNITIASSVDGATQYIKLSGNAAQTNQSAIKAFGVSNTGQTAGNTGVSTGIDWVLAGSDSLTLSQSTTAGGPNTVWFKHPSWITTATQSTQFLALTIAGNTAGTSTFHATNNASLFFNGGNNITLSGNGSTVTIIGPNTSAQQTGISGVVVSDTTYTSGTISFSNAGNITISSSVNAGTQYIKLSGNAAQTNQSAIKAFGASNTGNTAGNTGVSTGIDWVIAGSNNITISQSTAGGGPNTIWVSGPTGAQTGISGIIVSDATYTSGTVSFSNAGNITISSSVNGATQYIKLSGNAAQTDQSAIKAFGVSNTGQTAGNTGVSTGIDWVLAGSDSLTLSQSTAVGGPNTVWFKHPAWLTTAMASNRGSDFVQATAGFNGTNASGTIASNSISVSVAAPIPIATSVEQVASASSVGTITRYAPEDHRHAGIGAVGISTSGNTAGTTGSKQGTYWFQGGNAITLSQITSNNGSHTLVISGGVAAAQINFSAGTTSSNIGSVVFSDSNGVSFGLNGSTITATVSTYSTADTATTVKSVASANSVGTVRRWAAEDHAHAGIGGVGISTSGNSAGTSGSNVGTYWFQGGNNITLSQITSNNGSHTIVVSGPSAATSVNPVASASSVGTAVRWAPEDHRHAGIGAVGISTAGNTAGTTGSVVGTYWFQGGNNLTVSQITSNNGSHTLVLSAGAAGGAMSFSAGTSTGTLGSLVFSDSNGVSFGLNGSTLTATVATFDTVGTATTVKSVASANSVGTVTRWAAEDHAHAGIGAVGISTGNTSGTTGSVQGTYWFQGSNNVTVSQITSNNGSHTLVLSGPSLATLSYYANQDRFIDAGSTTLSASGSVLQVVPFILPQAVSGLFMRVPVSMSFVSTEVSGTTANSTWTYQRVHSHAVAIMTQNTGASSLSLVYSTSTAAAWTVRHLIGAGAQGSRYTVSQEVSYPVSGTTSSYTTSYPQSSANVQVSSASLTLFTGPRFLDIPFGISLSPGNYWAVFGMSTNSATTGGGNAAIGGASLGFSSVGISHSNLAWGRVGEVTNSSVNIMPWVGSWSTNAAVMSTSSIAQASVSVQSSHPLMYFQIHRFA